MRLPLDDYRGRGAAGEGGRWCRCGVAGTGGREVI